jgi:hypothetical protein
MWLDTLDVGLRESQRKNKVKLILEFRRFKLNLDKQGK